MRYVKTRGFNPLKVVPASVGETGRNGMESSPTDKLPLGIGAAWALSAEEGHTPGQLSPTKSTHGAAINRARLNRTLGEIASRLFSNRPDGAASRSPDPSLVELGGTLRRTPPDATPGQASFPGRHSPPRTGLDSVNLSTTDPSSLDPFACNNPHALARASSSIQFRLSQVLSIRKAAET